MKTKAFLRFLSAPGVSLQRLPKKLTCLFAIKSFIERFQSALEGATKSKTHAESLNQVLDIDAIGRALRTAVDSDTYNKARNEEFQKLESLGGTPDDVEAAAYACFLSLEKGGDHYNDFKDQLRDRSQACVDAAKEVLKTLSPWEQQHVIQNLQKLPEAEAVDIKAEIKEAVERHTSEETKFFGLIKTVNIRMKSVTTAIKQLVTDRKEAVTLEVATQIYNSVVETLKLSDEASNKIEKIKRRCNEVAAVNEEIRKAYNPTRDTEDVRTAADTAADTQDVAKMRSEADTDTEDVRTAAKSIADRAIAEQKEAFTSLLANDRCECDAIHWHLENEFGAIFDSFIDALMDALMDAVPMPDEDRSAPAQQFDGSYQAYRLIPNLDSYSYYHAKMKPAEGVISGKRRKRRFKSIAIRSVRVLYEMEIGFSICDLSPFRAMERAYRNLKENGEHVHIHKDADAFSEAGAARLSKIRAAAQDIENLAHSIPKLIQHLQPSDREIFHHFSTDAASLGVTVTDTAGLDHMLDLSDPDDVHKLAEMEVSGDTNFTSYTREQLGYVVSQPPSGYPMDRIRSYIQKLPVDEAKTEREFFNNLLRSVNHNHSNNHNHK